VRINKRKIAIAQCCGFVVVAVVVVVVVVVLSKKFDDVDVAAVI
jgi:hypothetical protein